MAMAAAANCGWFMPTRKVRCCVLWALGSNSRGSRATAACTLVHLACAFAMLPPLCLTMYPYYCSCFMLLFCVAN